MTGLWYERGFCSICSNRSSIRTTTLKMIVIAERSV